MAPTAPKTQTTSPTTTHFQRISPRWSALWAPHRLTSRPHHHQTGGIALHEAPTRRRHAPKRLHVVQNPQHFLHVCATSPVIPSCGAGMRDKVRPTHPLPHLTRENTRPARHKTPNLGHFSFAGRTFSRSRTPSGRSGRTFSRTGHSHVATMQPPSPLQPKYARTTPISHPQRRHRFQLKLDLREQRRQGFNPTRAQASKGATGFRQPRRARLQARSPEKSHAVRLDEVSTKSENIAIPTI